MVDHHVDRPEVEARRRVQLTGTNRSIGLIALIVHAHAKERGRRNQPEKRFSRLRLRKSAGQARGLRARYAIPPDQVRWLKACFTVFCWSGGSSEEPEPDPIPNSAVKLPSANDTSSQDVGK